MDKKLLPLIALLALGVGLATCLCTWAIWSYADVHDTEAETRTTVHRYEMPQITPVVRANF